MMHHVVVGVVGSTGGGDQQLSVSDVLHPLQQLLFPPLLLVSTQESTLRFRSCHVHDREEQGNKENIRKLSFYLAHVHQLLSLINFCHPHCDFAGNFR
jgi:hypothetical protein